MNIIVEGDCSRLKKTKRFECEECGCIFEADKDEYKYCGSQREGDEWYCICPTCGNKTYTTDKGQITRPEPWGLSK